MDSGHRAERASSERCDVAEECREPPDKQYDGASCQGGIGRVEGSSEWHTVIVDITEVYYA